MKKKLKISLIVFGIIVLSTASYLLYIFKFKPYDVADEEIDEIMGEEYTIELPDGTSVTMDEDGTIVSDWVSAEDTEKKEKESDDDLTKQDTTADEGDKQAVRRNQSSHETSQSHENAKTTGSTENTSNDKSARSVEKTGSAKSVEEVEGGSSSKSARNTENKTAKTGSSGKESVPTKPTVADIKNKYVPTLETLQSQADGKLNALIGRAKAEYSHKQANGESIDYGYFYNKYYGAANALEAQTDSVFHGVLQAVEQDLAANGYNESYAQSFLDDYNAKKKARRDSLLNQALGR